MAEWKSEAWNVDENYCYVVIFNYICTDFGKRANFYLLGKRFALSNNWNRQIFTPKDNAVKTLMLVVYVHSPTRGIELFDNGVGVDCLFLE